MKTTLKVALLGAIITAALGYVVSERLGSAPPEPAQGLAAPSPEPIRTAAPPAPATPVAFVPEPVRIPDNGGLSDDERTNIDIYERLSPGVVNITTSTYTYNVFFQVVPQSGAGSGVVLDRDGHVATNYHVIESAVVNAARYQPAEITVTLSDQSRHPARVVGIDPSNDLAVIRVDTGNIDWVPIPLGSTDGLRVGQKVLAIGNPFGLDRTLTTGIISSLGRSIEATNGRIIEGIIQTDAAINPGNSGGPLLDTLGELIGINTAIVSGASGVGFAVPVDTVRRVTHDLVTYGRVRRAYLIGGASLVSLSSLGRDLISRLDLGTGSGVMIAGNPGDTPATRAGLKAATRALQHRGFLIPVDGDVIVRIADRPVRTSVEIAAALEPYRPGDDVEVTVYRDRDPLTVTVTLGEEPVP